MTQSEPIIVGVDGSAAALDEAFVYRRGHLLVPLTGRTVVLADDGVVTGSTLSAAIHALRAREPGRVILAVVNAPTARLATLADQVDRTVCLFPSAGG